MEQVEGQGGTALPALKGGSIRIKRSWIVGLESRIHLCDYPIGGLPISAPQRYPLCCPARTNLPAKKKGLQADSVAAFVFRSVEGFVGPLESVAPALVGFGDSRKTD